MRAVLAAIALFLSLPHVGEVPSTRYSPTVRGSVSASRLAGVEPDGDPLYQVVLKTRLSASGTIPAVNLIVSSYLENFKPDTTPILPDLLHPKKTAQNLGGFLQGKALLTDDAGTVLCIGSFVADAFLDNSNHAAMTLIGSGTAFGGKASLRGSFVLHHDGSLSGGFAGYLHLPVAARNQIMANRGAKMRPIKDIISVVTVKPAPMLGKPTGPSVSTPLPSRYVRPPVSQSTTRHISPWSIVAGVGAIVSLIMAAVLYVMERRKTARTLT